MPAAPPPQQWPRGPTNDLHKAAKDGSVKRAVALLSRGSSLDINQGTPDGFTALMVGAVRGYSSIVRILLNKGADTSVATDTGITALNFSAAHGHRDASALLIEAGADLQSRTSEGFTPLHQAAQNGHWEVVTALVNAGADLEATCSGDLTPLHVAAHEGHWEVVTALVNAGADLQATCSVGFTPLHVAAHEGTVDVATALVKAGADPEANRCGGITPLHLAADAGLSTLVRAMIDAGAHSDTRDFSGETPLDSVSRKLRAKKTGDKDDAAEEDRLRRLDGVRRLLLRVEAVHALSWLWHTHVPIFDGAAEGGRAQIVSSTSLTMMLQALRRRASRRVLLLRGVFRWVKGDVTGALFVGNSAEPTSTNKFLLPFLKSGLDVQPGV